MNLKDKNPGQLAQERLLMSEEYSRYSGELANLYKKEAEFFNSRRQDFKSDNATSKAFAVTEDGVRMTIIKLKLKSLEKSMSAIKSLLETENVKAFGAY